MAKIKKLPTNEIIQVTATTLKKEVFVITKKPMAGDAKSPDLFFLYKKVADGYEKLGKGEKTPTEFDKIIWKQ